MDDLWIRYVHFLGIFLMAGTLILENVQISKHPKPETLKMLIRIDAFYGISAMVTLIAGLLLWLSVGKPSEFYSNNPVFMVKLTLFIFIALLSLIPTIFLVGNYLKKPKNLIIPAGVIAIKRIELALLSVLPLLAVFMAKGIGITI